MECIGDSHARPTATHVSCSTAAFPNLLLTAARLARSLRALDRWRSMLLAVSTEHRSSLKPRRAPPSGKRRGERAKPSSAHYYTRLYMR